MRTFLFLLLTVAFVACMAPAVFAQDEIPEELQDELDDLNDRLDALEIKTAKDKVSFFGDFRVMYNYLKYDYADYYQYTGGDPMDPMNYAPVEAFSLTNGEAWSARLRLKLDAKPTDEIHFTGRLVMHHLYGGGDVQIFNGFPNTVANGFNTTAFPGDNIIRVERAAFTYSPNEIPLFFTLGRQAATGGPPRELREDRVRQATPGALMIDAEIDGIMLGFKMDELLKMPADSKLRLCYGTGYESSFGAGGRVKQTMVNTPAGPTLISGLKDSKVAGGCLDTSIPPIPGNTLLMVGYFRMLNMTDIATGYTRSFPDPMNSDPQLLTATRNLGDMDLYGLCFQHEINDWAWFASVAGNTSRPTSGAMSAYGFGGLLGDTEESQSGYSVYIGGRAPIEPINGKLGLEWNYGSKNWFSYTPAGDDFAMPKLATRGNVFEGYYIQALGKKMNLRFGVQAYQYDYAFSGWHISPAPIDNFKLDATPAMAYPFPDKVLNGYAMVDVNF
jgi:hypothetical protein